MRPGSGHEQVGGHVGRRPEAGTERSGRPAGHGVGIGEDDLADDAVGVELAVASARVPAPVQALGVLALPLLGELLVAQPPLGEVGLDDSPCLQVLREGVPVPGVEPLAVLLARQPGVAVRRDHHVPAHACAPFPNISVIILERRAGRSGSRA